MAAQTKTPALGFDTAPGLSETLPNYRSIPMENVPSRTPVRNLSDLPLFQFAARIEDTRRATFATLADRARALMQHGRQPVATTEGIRKIRRTARVQSHSTAKLYAERAGLPTEDDE
ncbi:hypothetical protein [Maricaulis sp.]|uniref:hypothetical protein n=1 Tax=Maricaulis sp. TaxID=1486257 RepID=UPI003A902DDF